MGGRVAAQRSDLGVPEIQVFDEIKAALATAELPEAKARRVVEAIRRSRNYRWAGIYEIGAEEIAAIAWTGSDPRRFRAFRKRRVYVAPQSVREGTVVVEDVANDPRYLTTIGATQSEIVVPIFARAAKSLIGLIDVESERPNAVSDNDRVFLEGCAALVASLF
jgi:putative methionine-R-sulfoxide reductase with GAF domain